MFTITFENETHNQWSCEYIFESYDDAKTYLKAEGFSPKQGLFVRNKLNWSGFKKAYITPRKMYELPTDFKMYGFNWKRIHVSDIFKHIGRSDIMCMSEEEEEVFFIEKTDVPPDYIRFDFIVSGYWYIKKD